LDKFLDYTSIKSFNKEITISGSKSESNRLLILQKLYDNLKIDNLGNAEDIIVLKRALSSPEKEININHAGTAMRFLTAYYASVNNKIVLTGSYRMQERPIKLLVDALKKLGSEITYLKENGFPPIKIKGNIHLTDYIKIDGSISSQYITALLLIAPSLKNGLTIKFTNKLTSKPYVEMTLSLLKKIGVETQWFKNKIKVYPKNKIDTITITVEPDWSSASYYYSLIALSKNGKIKLIHFNKKSLQGDCEITTIYKNFGVKTVFNKDGITLSKNKNFIPKKHLSFNLIKTPDIAQTIAVTCLGLGISCDLNGLHTLRIKETNRLEALEIELKKFGAKIRITEDSLHLKMKSEKLKVKNEEQYIIDTYLDHRMAMAFTPLSLLVPIAIKNAEVVNKSYPNFWSDFEKIMK
jgi:3-phosphoshikimate 1-carboxyvinyltransferase